MRRPWHARRELEIVLLVVAAGLAAFGVNAALRLAANDPALASTPAAPPPAAPLPLDAYASIAARDVFNAGARPSDTADAPPVRLVGVGFRDGEARAAIEDVASRRQELVGVGDAVAGGRVTAIAWDHVVIATERGERVLEVAHAPEREAEPPPAAAPIVRAAAGTLVRQTSPTAFLVDRRELAGAVDDMSGLMTQLRAVAEVEDGRPAGFRLFQIREDSVFRRLGLENGDVVQRVNGQAVADPATLLAFLQRLRTEPRVALQIRRGQERRTLVYDLR